MSTVKGHFPWVIVLACGLVAAAWIAGACRQPSPAVPTEVEIDWPDAATRLDAAIPDAGMAD